MKKNTKDQMQEAFLNGIREGEAREQLRQRAREACMDQPSAPQTATTLPLPLRAITMLEQAGDMCNAVGGIFNKLADVLRIVLR